MPEAMLAREDIRLAHGSHTVRLRPTLRAATRLERLHNGYGPLFDRLAAFHIGTVHEIIRTAATDPDQADRFLASFAAAPLQRLAEITQAPLADLITGFLLPQSSKGDTGQGRAVPWSEAYAQLFRFGTGWLQWTPQETWNATPDEILEAVEGHIGKLKAIHGAADDDEAEHTQDDYTADRLHQIAEQGFDPEFDREGLHALKGKL